MHSIKSVRSLTSFSFRLFATTVKVPYMADSISQGTLASWEAKENQFVQVDQVLANIETEKVTIPVNAPKSGKLISILKKEGETVQVGADLCIIDESAKENVKEKRAE